MSEESKSNAWVQVLGVIAVALIGGAVTIWTQRPQRDDTPKKGEETQQQQSDDENHTHLIGVMGQLEPGINRQGMDFSANAIPAENAPICAESCRTDTDCKAMTYVVSMKSCWLKRGVPPPYPPGGPDYISAVKQ